MGLVVVALATVGLTMPAAGAADEPVVTVTPATDLVDGAVVHVTVTGAQPEAEVFALLCAADTADTTSQCAFDVSRSETTDATGRSRVRHGHRSGVLRERACPATKSWTAGSRPGATCASMTQRTDGSTTTLAIPLEFDADAPLLPPPTITVEPASDLVDGQTVQVTGTGFVPLTGVVLSQCELPAIDDNTCEQPTEFVNVAADGTFTHTLDVAADHPPRLRPG